jgi:hypothetical protein
MMDLTFDPALYDMPEGDFLLKRHPELLVELLGLRATKDAMVNAGMKLKFPNQVTNEGGGFVKVPAPTPPGAGNPV